MQTFQVGKTYQTRSVCDHNCIIGLTVVRRTNKTITTKDGKTFRISVFDNAEFVRPWGNYSMAPIVDASKAV